MSLHPHASLGVHLEGIHKAMLSLALHLKTDEDARIVRGQLEWAASHLRAAIRELKSDPVQAREGAPPALPIGVETSQGNLMEGLRGHTQAITIPEVLGFVSSLRKSGVLRVKSSDEAFLIQLEKGEVVYAQGDNPPDGQMLGEILVAQGALTASDVEDVLASDAAASGMLGEALIAAGRVTRRALTIALSYQVQTIFHRVFEADDAVFQFDEGVSLRTPADVRLNVTTLLLESARSSDEGLRNAV